MKEHEKQLEVEMNGTLDLGKVPSELLQLFCQSLAEGMEALVESKNENNN